MKRESYSVSLVTQGRRNFYTLTMPMSILAKTCYVDSREENPQQGFQRVLDEKRAKEIAVYIDELDGVIPTSIILSAQEDSSFEYNSKNKTVSFDAFERAFLVLDGQHRIYGFTMAKSDLRVPVVIFSGLTKVDEARLFIDINTKQKPVPNELLLDIKNLALYESEKEEYMRHIYNSFDELNDSFFRGYLVPAKKERGKITRVTFNNGVKLILSQVIGNQPEKVYQILNNYFFAISKVMPANSDKRILLTNPILFQAVIALFPKVSLRVSDKYGSEFSIDNFASVLMPIKENLNQSVFINPGRSYKSILSKLEKAIDNVTLTF